MSSADIELERGDRKVSAWQTNAVPAFAGFTGSRFEGNRRSQRDNRRLLRLDSARGDPCRQRNSRAVGLVPRHADVAVGARGKRQIEMLQFALGQIEDGRLVKEDSPPRTVTAALEIRALHERRRNALDAYPIDC